MGSCSYLDSIFNSNDVYFIGRFVKIANESKKALRRPKMAVKYVCDRCGLEVPEKSSLFSVIIINENNTALIRTDESICEKCGLEICDFIKNPPVAQPELPL